MEHDQVLKVGINALNLGRGWQFFYAKMEEAGRIHISKSVLSVLQGEKPSLAGYMMEITLEPA
jgi:hypothetical protein